MPVWAVAAIAAVVTVAGMAAATVGILLWRGEDPQIGMTALTLVGANLAVIAVVLAVTASVLRAIERRAR